MAWRGLRRPSSATPDRGARRTCRPAEVELVPRPEGGRQARVVATAADCLLDRYRAGSGGVRGRVPLITGRQHEAGLRLRRLWDVVERPPRLIARYDPAPTARPGGAAVAGDGGEVEREGARRALARALAGLTEAERRLAENVCRHDCKAGSEMRILREALDRLAAHWKLPAETTG